MMLDKRATYVGIIINILYVVSEGNKDDTENSHFLVLLSHQHWFYCSVFNKWHANTVHTSFSTLWPRQLLE